MPFKPKRQLSINKTIRMPYELIAGLENLAFINDISFSQLVIQCCQYSLENLELDLEDISEDYPQ